MGLGSPRARVNATRYAESQTTIYSGTPIGLLVSLTYAIDMKVSASFDTYRARARVSTI